MVQPVRQAYKATLEQLDLTVLLDCRAMLEQLD
jgi:hypothetical protein